MQQNNNLLKSGAQYPIVAMSTALLLAVVAVIAQKAFSLGGSTDGLHMMYFVDMRVAAIVSLLSLAFYGMWQADPATPLGQWALRGGIALLVAINWAAWAMAFWLH